MIVINLIYSFTLVLRSSLDKYSIQKWILANASVRYKSYQVMIVTDSPGYLCHIGAEPTTNCNSNETYVILFQIYPCITY